MVKGGALAIDCLAKRGGSMGFSKSLADGLKRITIVGTSSVTQKYNMEQHLPGERGRHEKRPLPKHRIP